MGAIFPSFWVLLGIVIPGYVVTRRVVRSADLIERAVYSVGLGLLIVPQVVFLLSWAFEVPFDRTLILLSGLALVLACRPWGLTRLPLPSRAQVLSVAALAMSALVLLQLSEIRHTSDENIFNTCLYFLSLFLQQHDGSGLAVFYPEHGQHFVHLLTHDTSLGLGLVDVMDIQRPANGAILASQWALAGQVALEITTILVFFVVAGTSTLIARTRLDSLPLSLAVGVTTLVTIHGLIGFMVNSSTFALVAGLVALALLTRTSQGVAQAVVAGAALGIGLGSRLAAVFWLLPVALLMGRSHRRLRLGAAAGFVLTASTWLSIAWLLKGSPFYHAEFDDSVIEQTVLGIDFTFRPLNWPFYDQLVRHPSFALPPLLYLPLLMIRSAGSALFAAVAIGFALSWRASEGVNPRRTGWLLLAFAVPIVPFLLVLAYIDYEKASWLLVAAPALPLALAIFTRALLARAHRVRVVSAWAALSLVIAFVPGWLATVEVPLDPRDYGIVEPDQEQFEDVPEADQRAWLGRFALLPSLHSIEFGSRLFSTPYVRADADELESGSVLVHVYDDGPTHFSMHLPEVEPEIFDNFEQDPGPWSEGLPDEIQIIHFRVTASPRVDIRLEARMEAASDWAYRHYTLEIDPGSTPHTERWVSFLLEDHFIDELGGISVSVAGEPLPVWGVGYLVRPEGRAERRDVRLVTNVEVAGPESGAGRFDHVWGGGTFEWMPFEALGPTAAGSGRRAP